MVKVLLTVAYDGTGFSGWQRQRNAPSVQEEIERALTKLLNKDISVIGASRTDAGVHAAGQRCSFVTDRLAIPVDRLPYAVNSALRSDVSVLKAEIVPPELHPRFSAKTKTYEYVIYNGAIRDPLLRNRSWHIRTPLDTEKISAASSFFIGVHDFKAFCASGSDTKNFTRTILSLQIKIVESQLIMRITGDGFLYNMVRIIAGTLAHVGLGKIEPDDIPRIINSGERSLAGVTAPPQGLTLMEITY